MPLILHILVPGNGMYVCVISQPVRPNFVRSFVRLLSVSRSPFSLVSNLDVEKEIFVVSCLFADPSLSVECLLHVQTIRAFEVLLVHMMHVHTYAI